MKRYLSSRATGAILTGSLLALFSTTGWTQTDAQWTGGGTENRFLDGANWSDSVPPDITRNLFFNAGNWSDLFIDEDGSSRQITAQSGEVTIELRDNRWLTLDSTYQGWLMAQAGAKLTVQHALGSESGINASALEAWGTETEEGVLTINTRIDLTGGDANHPQRGARYGLVVGEGGRIILEENADIRFGIPGPGTAAVRIGEAVDHNTQGVLEIRGGSLKVGLPTSEDQPVAFQVGDWGSKGLVDQSGGEVQIIGSLNIGNQGGEGIYRITGGKLTLNSEGESHLASIGRNAIAAGETTPISEGRLEIGGTGVVELVDGTLVNGNRMESTSGGAPVGEGYGIIEQTGGTLHIAASGLLFLSGRGNENPDRADGIYNLYGGVLEVGGNSLRPYYLPASGSRPTPRYEFNLGGGTIRVTHSDLTSTVIATLRDSTTSTIETGSRNARLQAINGTGGSLTKTGTGRLDLTGTSSWTGGDFLIEGGFALAETSTLTIGEGTRLSLSGTALGDYSISVGITGGRTARLNMTDGEINMNIGMATSSQSLQIGNRLEGSGTATGVMNMSGGTVTFHDHTPNSAVGSLQIGSLANSSGTLNQSGGQISYTGTEGAMEVYLGGGTGAGSYHLSGNAALDIVGGAIHIGLNANGNGTLSVRDTATVAFRRQSTPESASWTGQILVGYNGGTGTIEQEGGHVLLHTAEAIRFGYADVSSGNISQGAYQLDDGLLEMGSDMHSVIFGASAGDIGSFEQTGGTLRVNQGNGHLTIGSLGTGSFTQSSGTSTIEGNLTVAAGAGSSGTVAISNTAIMELGGGLDSLRAGAGTANFTTAGGTVRIINEDFSTSLNASIQVGTTFTIDTGSYRADWDGALTGAGGLLKVGTGLLVLSQENSYLGQTIVRDGELRVNGAINSLLVEAEGQLSGTGVIHASATIAGRLNPGQSPGTLTFLNGLTLQSGSITTLEITLDANDKLDVSNLFQIQSGASLVLSLGSLGTSEGTFALFEGTTVTGDFSQVSITGAYGNHALAYDALSENWVWGGSEALPFFTFNTTSGQVSYEAIPEPSSLLLFGASTLLLGIMARRRKAKAAL